jgi:hypothetical protein
VSGSPVPVEAGWAVWGKRAGTNEDYSILSCGTQPLSRAEYASIVAYFTPGNPPVDRGRADSLPWVTFSQVGVDGQPYVGISVQELTSQVDGVGRPIAKTSFFCAPYADLADPPVSCLGLYQAVVDMPLPDRDGPPVRLTITPADPATLAGMIRKVGLDTVVTTASLLLSGPVTITGAESSTLLERLWFIDAVAALLPFAYRASYTAATWSDKGAGQRIRLAFASHGPAGTATVKWQSQPEAIETDGAARLYCTRLAGVLSRPSAGDPLTRLIQSFASLAGPARKLDEPQYALDSLREIDLPTEVLNAAREGVAKPDEIRLVFASGRITELPHASARQLLEKLIALGDPQDWPTIAHWFGPVAGPKPGELMGTVTSTCHTLLWSAADSQLIREYLILAAHYDLEDELLARLMAPPKSADDLKSGLGTAARLLADSVLASPDDTARYPRTRQALTKNPAVACEVLTQLAGAESGTRVAVAWIEPVLGDFLRPFINVLGDPPSPAGQGALDQLAVHGASWIRALLQTASNANRLDYAVPGFASWLAADAAEKGMADKAMRQYWRNTVGALKPRAEATRAWLDICLLLTGNDPLFLLADREDRRRFNECFAVAWQQLASETPASDVLLTTALAGYLGREPWTASVELAADVADLVERLTPDRRRSQLEVVVTRMLSAAPGAATWDFAARWLAQTETIRPGTADSLRYMRGSPTYAQMAEACTQAALQGVRAREAAQALADSRLIESGAQAEALMEALRVTLSTAGSKRVDAGQWLLVFIELFTGGAFGERVAAEFPDRVITKAIREARYRLSVLRYTASGGRQDVMPALSSETIEELERIRRAADEIIRDARKGSGRGHLRRGKQSADARGAQS